jgi:hypothetical protein
VSVAAGFFANTDLAEATLPPAKKLECICQVLVAKIGPKRV